MYRVARSLLVILVFALVTLPVFAHFQALLPDPPIVESPEDRTVTFDIRFTHPMEGGPVMDMGTPVRAGVLVGGETEDLRESLVLRPIDDKKAYSLKYAVKKPGDHIFFLEPAPYWEPAEGKMIIHYTKVVVNAYGDESGWDAAVGLPVEIEPLVRPYGLWAGNLFRGVAKRDGKPIPYAEVEVEYWNGAGKITPPTEAHVTQVIKADGNGVFSYAMPFPGWWAFAVLVDGDTPMANPEGEMVDVELGGLMWVHCSPVEKGN